MAAGSLEVRDLFAGMKHWAGPRFFAGDPGDRTLALRGVTAIDVERGGSLPGHTVLIREGRIRWVGPDSAAGIPDDARSVDASGKYLIPGLWDVHLHLSKARASALRLFVANGVLDWREQAAERGDAPSAFLERVRRSTIRNVREMHEVGLPVLVGTDVAVLGVVPGFATHEELTRFVDELGYSSAEALGAATIGPARYLGLADSTGTVEIGKWADLVLLDESPLEDIRHTRAIWAVVRNGRFLGPDALDRLLTGVEHARDRRINDWTER